ncbi:hypothetical protein [Reinekea marinisedimentorum]|uniref:hypothetical protein n=1 Tax=Reinekea marinisedimentorum TaxID=230495 RepID=UPI001046D368|nr:hypothetical protein [Reinekea marinisedimentorum]
MKEIYRDLIVIIVAAISTLIWMFGFGKIHYLLYIAVGAPEQPTKWLHLMLLAQSCLMGFLPSMAVGGIMQSLRSFWVYVIAVFSCVLFVTAFMNPNAVLGRLSSSGFWYFILGGLLGGALPQLWLTARNKTL